MKNSHLHSLVLLALSWLFLLNPLHAQTQLWGMTYTGGEGGGTILNLQSDGSNFSARPFSFEQPGTTVQADLLASGGKFYGMTTTGGAFDFGVLFEYDPAGGGTYTVLQNFDDNTGGNPYGNLIESGGKFYGVTYVGGSGGSGTIFEYDPAGGGAFTVLYAFDILTGGYPIGSLLESNGKFYGITEQGGTSSFGVLFEYDPAGGGTYTVLYEFNEPPSLYSSLIESGGKFYGMRQQGGAFFYGVIFEYDPAGGGTYTVLHDFDYSSGGIPYGKLLAYNGKLYGMTEQGGSFFWGVIFEYDLAGGGTYNVLHNFENVYGIRPFGGLIESSGKFYGMTFQGGSTDGGVIFEYDPAGSGSYNLLHEFDETNGRNPVGSLIKAGGKFYGMTSASGTGGAGVIFEYDPAGTYSVLMSFQEALEGSFPFGDLLESGGKYYGMTTFGGSINGYGVLFEYDPAGGGAFNVLHNFDFANGGSPFGSLIESGGKFYGMASAGGSFNGGVIFEYDPAGGGAFNVLHNFDYPNGGNPFGSLIASGGKFYGTTYGGGSAGAGVLFEFDPAGGGTYNVLHHFSRFDGSNPRGSLLEYDGKFYGMTEQGGAFGLGVLFAYDLAASGMTILYDFNFINGGYPAGSLIESGGKLYGLTSAGGFNGSGGGVIFEYDPAGSGTYSIRHDFFSVLNGGASPLGSLVEADGKFYGMTYEGGTSLSGVVFEYDPAGSGAYTVLHHLNGGSDGKNPTGSLIAISSCATPTFSACPGNMVVDAASNACDAVVEYAATASGTPAPALSYEFSGATTGSGSGTGSGSTFAKGITTVVITATSACGAPTCTFTVTVNDVTAPELSCPANKVLVADVNCTGMLGSHAPTAVSDNCTANPMVTQSPAASTLLSGHNDVETVTLSATDGNGNTRTCTFTVTLQDQTRPTMVCPPDLTVTADANCESTVGTHNPTALSDNCTANPTVAQSPAPETALYATETVTLTATDAAGNTRTCQFTVTPSGGVTPGITCPANKTLLASLTCTATLGSHSPVSTTDVCGGNGLDITQNPASSTVLSGHNTNQTVTLTATANNGNTATCSFSVTLQDQRKPSITCPTEKNISADANCKANLGSWSPTAVSDNCTANPTVTQSPASSTELTGHNTVQTVTLEAADAAGNTRSCTFKVTLRDKSKPTLVCPANKTINTDAGCQAELGSHSPVTIKDNCSTPTLVQVPHPADVMVGHGTMETVTLTATDAAGNWQACTFTVTLHCASLEPTENESALRDLRMLDPKDFSLKVFPNPNEGVFSVEAQLAAAPDAVYKFVLWDVLGKQVLRQEGGAQQTFHLGELPSGVYTLEACSAGEHALVKVVVQR